MRQGLLCLALVSLLAVSGCAASSSEARRQTLLEARAGAHVYRRPAPEVATAVRAELEAEGYHLLAAEEDGLLRTEWKFLVDGAEFATARDRYVVLVKRLTARHCRVEAVRVSLSTLGSESAKPYHMMVPPGIAQKYVSTTIAGVGDARPAVPRVMKRDLSFEWRVLRRADPEGARRLDVGPLTAAP